MPQAGNLLSGNGAGVVISGTDGEARSNVVRGNWIGTNTAGTSGLGNAGDGVLVEGSGATETVISGNVIAAAGMLSGGTAGQRNGVRVEGAGQTTVSGNMIGANTSGGNVIANADDGVTVRNASANVIGGDTPETGNTIAGSTNGISISATYGAAHGNTVQGNRIGTSTAGTVVLGNRGNGVHISGAQSTGNAVHDNVIAGSGHLTGGSEGQRNGVLISEGSNNTLESNRIGTNTTGDAVLGNADAGVCIDGGVGNVIGGVVPSRRNTIAGNGEGVRISGTNVDATDNLIRNNYIGTNHAGTAILGNLNDGVVISGDRTTRTSVTSNLVAGAGHPAGGQQGRDNGIYIDGSGGNFIRGNTIGTNDSGTAVLANAGNGVIVDNGSQNIIGGTAIGDGNLIANNGGDGIQVITGTGNSILSNLIWGNDGVGIDLYDGGNNEQSSPVITSVRTGSTIIRGMLRANPSTHHRIELFESEECDPSGAGEGQSWLGFVEVDTDSNGLADFELTTSSTVDVVTATATDADGNTSRFSRCFRPLIVNETGDEQDADTADGVCDHDLATAGDQCSLRAAIQQANANPELDVINFDIPGSGVPSIGPTSTLPVIDQPVIIDATTQPGGARVELEGSALGSGADGLVLSGGDSTVRGMVINRFLGKAIMLLGGGNNVVEGNLIGLDPSGTTDRFTGYGVWIDDSSDNVIGGLRVESRNVIAATEIGIAIVGGTGSASLNRIEGNYLGFDVTGEERIPNLTAGVMIWNGSQNRIGGSIPAARNVIANSSYGVALITNEGSRASLNVVEGNYIGLNAGGNEAHPLLVAGVALTNVTDNVIGGSSLESGNLIAGSPVGVWISGEGDGIATTFNTVQYNRIGVNATGEVIGNLGHGIAITGAGATDNTIRDNAILGSGLINECTYEGFEDCDGIHIRGAHHTTVHTNAVASNLLGTGILVNGGSDNVIGGTTTEERNVVTNNAYGIEVGEGAESTVVQNNHVGLNLDGEQGTGTWFTGITVRTGATNTELVNNTVAGCGAPGFPLTLENQSLASGVIIMDSNGTRLTGNRIGTNAAGTSAIGNHWAGVMVVRSADTMIGGAESGDSNVISSNRTGVQIIGTSTAHRFNTLQNNLIGTNAAGDAVIGNSTNGVWIQGAHESRVVFNVIAGSGAQPVTEEDRDGIRVEYGDGTQIWGNHIGTNMAGANMGSSGAGIRIDLASNTEIGAVGGAFGNTIAFNGAQGVVIVGGGSGNSIQSNSIHSNGGIGIDLGDDGVTFNDGDDEDDGVNRLQNFPVITSVADKGTAATITGTLDSRPDTQYRIELFSSGACDDSGFGEGETMLGSTSVTTDGSGDATFEISVGGAAGSITATATDPDGNTSEFSRCPTTVRGASIANPGSYVYGIAVAMHGEGAAETSWLSDLVLHNARTSSVPATVFFMRRGQDNSDADGKRVLVPAGSSIRLEDVVAGELGLGGGRGGLLIGAEQPLLLSSRTYTSSVVKNTGSFGQFVPATHAGDAIRGTAPASLIQLTGTAQARTNIGVTNLTGEVLDLSIEVANALGEVLGTIDLSVPPFGHHQVNGIFAGLSSAPVPDGYARLTAAQPRAQYLAYASVVDNASGDAIFVTPASEGSTALLIPAAASAHGHAGTRWHTDLQLFNDGNERAVCQADLLEADTDNSTPRQAGIAVPAGVSFRAEDALQRLFNFTGTAALRITCASGRVAASARTFNRPDPSSPATYGQYIPGEPIADAQVAGDTGRLLQLKHSTDPSRGSRTNIGVASATDAEIVVHLDLYDETGGFLGRQDLSVPPHGFTQLDGALSVVSTSDQDNAFAIVSSTSEGAAFFAYASVVDNVTGDAIYVPALIGED